jgi:hypothetical protein
MTPARAQQAPAPPGLGPAYFAKEKDPSGKKEKPTKTIRPAKCAECQEARDALQQAVENWYQFQADEAQKAIDTEKKKAKPNSNTIENLTKTKADAQQGAKQHPNAPKKKEDLAAEIAKLKKALDDCEKAPCGPKEGKKETHTKGFDDLPKKPKTQKEITQITEWIMGLPFPECADDKDKAAEKEKMKQMLKDAQAAAGLIPASAQADVAAYLKKMQDYIDSVIDGLPPCTVIHTPGYDKLPKPIQSEADIKTILDWLNGLKFPPCDDKDAIAKVKQMLKDAVDAVGLIQQATQTTKFKDKIEELKKAEELKKKIEDYLKGLKPCPEKSEIKGSSKFIFRSFGYYSRPGGNTYNVTFSGDSTQQCTFADGTGVPAPIEFADANGNSLETYFDPKTGESSDFGPDETPPPGWIKVIPTTDPKPKPGMWNLGHQPELWVDPNTGQTKWVEVGSDYKPVDPPQGWVELVPRKQPPETPPERPVATTETPPRTPTPETPKTPTTETPRPPTTEMPPRTPTTDTPRTPETPQPTQTTDAPPKTPTSDDIPSTVFVKANEEVVRGEPTGQPLASQIVKLLAERPALPSSRETKTVQDTGFDKPPAQCTTGADGRCKFEVPADERPVYGMPVTDTAARRPNYRVEFNALKSSGGVAEITGRKPGEERTPTDGGNIASDIFNIGSRIFQRFGFNTPYESREDVEASYRSAFGDKYQVDTCETKKLPGLPLDIEPSSFNGPNHELSRATIKLDRSARSGRTSR